jgi:hypothetical protein
MFAEAEVKPGDNVKNVGPKCERAECRGRRTWSLGKIKLMSSNKQ